MNDTRFTTRSVTQVTTCVCLGGSSTLNTGPPCVCYSSIYVFNAPKTHQYSCTLFTSLLPCAKRNFTPSFPSESLFHCKLVSVLSTQSVRLYPRPYHTFLICVVVNYFSSMSTYVYLCNKKRIRSIERLLSIQRRVNKS